MTVELQLRSRAVDCLSSHSNFEVEPFALDLFKPELLLLVSVLL